MTTKRRPRAYDREALLKAATLYYVDNLTQQELARRLGVSRPTIVRMLQEARRTGLVEIRITAKPLSATRLGAEIESRFEHQDLRQVIAVSATPSTAKDMVAKAAAEYLMKTMRQKDVVGVGWSSTLLHLPDHLKPARYTPQRIVQLGGYVSGGGDSSAQTISVNIGRILGVPVQSAPVPVLVSDKAICRALLREPVIKENAEWVAKCTIGLVGIGKATADSPLVTSGYLSAKDMDDAARRGAIGDILSHYFDIEGHEIQTSWRDRMISVDFSRLKKIDNLIAVAAGPDKAEAVLGAVRSGLVKTLIVDESLAARLLEISVPVRGR